MKIVAGTLLLTVAAFLFDSVETSEEFPYYNPQIYGSSKWPSSEGSSHALPDHIPPEQGTSIGNVLPGLRKLHIGKRWHSSKDSLYATSRASTKSFTEYSPPYYPERDHPQASHYRAQGHDDFYISPMAGYPQQYPYHSNPVAYYPQSSDQFNPYDVVHSSTSSSGHQNAEYHQSHIAQEPRTSKARLENQQYKESQTRKSFKDSESSHGSGSYWDS